MTGPVLFMYVGNLEPYQGIDLLLESFALHHARRPGDTLAIIGGVPDDIARYRTKADGLGLGPRVDFRGPKSIALLGRLLAEADVLVSPRIKGTNTPMKVYSYMDSGRPIVATRLLTHTQVLDDTTAQLAAPEPGPFADALQALATDATRRQTLAAAARERVRTHHSPAALKRSLEELYCKVANLTRPTPPE